MTRLLTVLALRALLLAVLIGALAVVAAPAFAGVERVWSTEEKLRLFADEITRASRELGLERPTTVAVVSVEEAMAMRTTPRAAAFVIGIQCKIERGEVVCHDSPWRVYVLWYQLMGASQAQLRCWARHEMTHVKLNHRYTKDQGEADRHHDAVRHFMEAKWRQDSSCGIR